MGIAGNIRLSLEHVIAGEKDLRDVSEYFVDQFFEKLKFLRLPEALKK